MGLQGMSRGGNIARRRCRRPHYFDPSVAILRRCEVSRCLGGNTWSEGRFICPMQRDAAKWGERIAARTASILPAGPHFGEGLVGVGGHPSRWGFVGWHVLAAPWSIHRSHVRAGTRRLAKPASVGAATDIARWVRWSGVAGSVEDRSRVREVVGLRSRGGAYSRAEGSEASSPGHAAWVATPARHVGSKRWRRRLRRKARRESVWRGRAVRRLSDSCDESVPVATPVRDEMDAVFKFCGQAGKRFEVVL